jgi:hypothetical protein
LKDYTIDLRNKTERVKILEDREEEYDQINSLLEDNPNDDTFYYIK